MKYQLYGYDSDTHCLEIVIAIPEDKLQEVFQVLDQVPCLLTDKNILEVSEIIEKSIEYSNCEFYLDVDFTL